MKFFRKLVIFAVLSFAISTGTLKIAYSNHINRPVASAQGAMLNMYCGWQELMNETFESSWPASLWNVFDQSDDGYDRKWDDDNYRPHSGSLAAWPARGGVDGRDPLPTNNDYFNIMNTRMTYGPFDLSDAAQAEVSFWLWREMESTSDYLALEVSNDNITFQEISRWTGNAGWEQKINSLNAYMGDSTVWVAWRFYSDRRNVFDGPWVDDVILRKFVNSSVTVSGSLSYFDRYDVTVGSPFTTAQLWDRDTGENNDDQLGETYTEWDGTFTFDPVPNFDDDPGDPNPCIDPYVVWVPAYNDSPTAQHRVVNLNGDLYQWSSLVYYNFMNDTLNVEHTIQLNDPAREAMWIFQDLRNAWQEVYSNTIVNLDPGSATVRWENGEDCFINLDPFFFICNSFYYDGVFGPFIFLSDRHTRSADAVVHETGHHYMDNANGFWWWYSDCWDHRLFNVQDQGCAWSEGWGDFFALFVNHDNDDTCYDFGIGPCGINGDPYEDLEAIERSYQPPYYWGDTVEGRVAGALYDIFDDNVDEGYDSANFGFDPIVEFTFQEPKLESLLEFWESWKGSNRYNKHNVVRALYQNTIDYDAAPHFTEDLMIRYAVKNQNRYRVLDLWSVSYDEESAHEEMIYEIVDQSSLLCGTKITDNRWIDIEPAPDFEGSCTYLIQVSDTILPDVFFLIVYVVPSGYFYGVYLPVVIQ